MTDKRPTLTIKGHQFTPEFRALINDAARAEGMTQAEWAYQVMSQAARQSISKETNATVDARLDRLEDIIEALRQSIEPHIIALPTAEQPQDNADHQAVATPSPQEREAERTRAKQQFVSLGVDVEPYADGLVLINGKYVVSLLGKRWRIVGKGKWYWFKTPEQLVADYITAAPR